MKYFVGHDKGEDIGARDWIWIWVGKATLYTFRPNNLLQQGFLSGVLVEFAEEKEGEFRSSDNNVRPREKQIITKLLKMTNYTVTNIYEWWKDSENYITTVLNVISQVILPKALLVRDIPTPRILLFIFQFTFEVK